MDKVKFNLSKISFLLKKLGTKGLVSAAFLLLMVVGSVAAYYLTGLNQDTRQQAAGGNYLVDAPKGVNVPVAVIPIKTGSKDPQQDTVIYIIPTKVPVPVGPSGMDLVGPKPAATLIPTSGAQPKPTLASGIGGDFVRPTVAFPKPLPTVLQNALPGQHAIPSPTPRVPGNLAACKVTSDCSSSEQCIGGYCTWRRGPNGCPSNQDYCVPNSRQAYFWDTCCEVGYSCVNQSCVKKTGGSPPGTPPEAPPEATPIPPSPTVDVLAQCTNIKMLDVDSVELTGGADASFIPGSTAVKFSCSANGNISKYEFRVILPNGTIETAITNPALAATGSITGNYIIPAAGKYTVQCRICTIANGCQAFEQIIASPTPIL